MLGHFIFTRTTDGVSKVFDLIFMVISNVVVQNKRGICSGPVFNTED